jgi:hypothetical protein
MEVTFRYDRDDWTAVSAETFRLWLHRLRPMTAEERVGGVACLIASLLALPTLLAVLAVGVWIGLAWYVLAALALMLPLPCLMIFAVLRPSEDGTKRGLVQELIFAWKWEGRLVAETRQKHGRHFRRLEAAGQLELGHQYVLRLEEAALALTTTYPPNGATSTTQQSRWSWDSVVGVERTDRLLLIHAGDGSMLCVSRSAFADEEEEAAFVGEVEVRRAASREHVMMRLLPADVGV